MGRNTLNSQEPRYRVSEGRVIRNPPLAAQKFKDIPFVHIVFAVSGAHLHIWQVNNSLRSRVRGTKKNTTQTFTGTVYAIKPNTKGPQFAVYA